MTGITHVSGSSEYSPVVWDAVTGQETQWDASPPLVRLEKAEVRNAVACHQAAAATTQEVQAALRKDITISESASAEALEASQPVPVVNPVVRDVTKLKSLAGTELLYVRGNLTVGTLRFDETVAPSFPSTWLADPLLVSKPGTASVFAVCKNRLFELSHGVEAREVRRFPGPIHDLAIHPTEDRIAVCRFVPGSNKWTLFMSKLDGSDETEVTDAYDPVWTNDGQTLLMTVLSPADGYQPMLRSGTEMRSIKLPTHPRGHVYPHASPDGQQLVFSMQGEDGTMQLGLIGIDGNNERQVTRTGDMNTRATFSPDGRFIAFVRGSRPCPLVVLKVETGEETIVAEDAESIRPIWRRITGSQN